MIETKFKNTGFHIIPLDWEEGCLEDYTIKIGSGATPTGGEASYKEEGISLIRSLNVYNDGFKYERLAHINKEQASELDNVTIEEGDVLVNITGASVARCCVVPNIILPARVNQHVSIVRTQEEVLNYKFLWFLLTSPLFQKELIALSKGNGGTREAITKKQLEEFLIILPSSTTEQSRIATALSDVDELIETFKKLIEKKRNIKKGAMQELLSGKRRLPGFIEKWEETRVGEFGEMIRGVNYSAEDASTEEFANSIPLLRSNNIQNNSVNYDNLVYVPRNNANNIQLLKSGDILICMANGSKELVGKTGLVKESIISTFGAFMGVFRLYDTANAGFIAQLLLTDFYKSLLKDAFTGSAINNLKSSDIENMMFYMPSTSAEKQAIAKVLSDMDSEITMLESRLIKYQSLKQGMMQQLLTGKIRLI